MMSKKIVFLLHFLILYTGNWVHAQANVEIPLVFSGANWGVTNSSPDNIVYAIGTDPSAKDGFQGDNFDDPIPPPPFREGFGGFDVDDFATLLAKDIREELPMNGTTDITFELQLIFGFEAPGASGTNFDITMTWDSMLFNSQSAFAMANYTKAEIRDPDSTAMPPPANVDMSTTNSIQFAGLEGESRSILITFTKGQTNLTPIARNDAAVTFVGDPVFNIPVLANDIEPDGDPISIVGGSIITITNGVGTIAINGDQIQYTPPTTGMDAIEEFSYQVMDDGGKTDTGIVRIEIFSERLIVRRTHANRLKIGNGPSPDGLLVNIQIDYPQSETLSTLNLTEIFDEFDRMDGFYVVAPDGSGFDVKAGETQDLPSLFSDLANNTPYNGSNQITFSYPDNNIPPSPINFSYRIIGGENQQGQQDTMQKKIIGSATFAITGESESTISLEETTFTPTNDLFHTADYQGASSTEPDSKIDANELFDVIVLFNAGEYHIDANENSGYGPGTGDQSGMPHSADYQGGAIWWP